MIAAWSDQVFHPIFFTLKLRGCKFNSHGNPANAAKETNTPSTLPALRVIARREVFLQVRPATPPVGAATTHRLQPTFSQRMATTMTSATFLEVIPEITIPPDVILEIVIALDIVIEIAIAGLDSTSDFLRPPFLFQQSFAKELAADFPDPAFCLSDSTFELIPIHDFLLTTISRISRAALTAIRLH